MAAAVDQSPDETAQPAFTAPPPASVSAPPGTSPAEVAQAAQPGPDIPQATLPSGTVLMIGPDQKAYSIPHDRANDAVTKGGFKLAQEMIQPDGKSRSAIPVDRVHDAMHAGWQMARPGMPQTFDRTAGTAPQGLPSRAQAEAQVEAQKAGTLAGFPGASPNVPSDWRAMLPGAAVLGAAGTVAGGSMALAGGQAAAETLLPPVTAGVKSFNSWAKENPAQALMAWGLFQHYILDKLPGFGTVKKAIKAYEPPGE